VLSYSSIIPFVLVLGGLAWMGLRDHRARYASRASLLDECAVAFDRHAITHDGDHFPKLSGRIGSRNIDLRLISDTMTIRRLPQLWMQVTQLVRLEDVGGFAILVRPSGYEFYSMTAGYHHLVETPAGFPGEVIIRAKDRKAALMFERMAPAIAPILEDACVKEVAVAPEGIRIIRQASEGKRGDYLLLRQAVFEEASVSTEMLDTMLRDIDSIHSAFGATKRETIHA
jgi:hypothetical protein